MSILVIGAFGGLGTALCERFAITGYVVWRLGRNFRLTCLSLNQEGVLSEVCHNIVDVEGAYALSKPTATIYLVSLLGPSTVLEEDVFRSLALKEKFLLGSHLDLCRKFHVPKFLYFSSGGSIYGDCDVPRRESDEAHPVTQYGMVKRDNEDLLRSSTSASTKLLCLRVSNPYGFPVSIQKRQGIVPIAAALIKRGDPVRLFGEGNELRDYIFIDDLFLQVRQLLYYSGVCDTFNICFGTSHSTSYVLDLIASILELPCDKEYEDDTRRRSIDVRLSNELAKTELGIASMTPLKQGVVKFLSSLDT